MRLSNIRGQERAVSLLRSSLERGRVHHAFLLSGPQGVGKETTALALAASLLCPERGEGEADACGTCLSCGKVERGTHPDLLQFLPEASAVERGLLAKEDLPRAPSRDLKIEQIRSLERSLSVAPVESARRVVFLLEADSMNVPAQNAFLKTLEEPPAGTHLLLVATSGDSLLPTIRSRCVRLPFLPLPKAQVAAWLEEDRKLDGEIAQLVAGLSGGSLGEAARWDEAALRERGEVLAAVEALEAGNFRAVLALAERMAQGGRDAAAASLDALGLFYLDAARLGEGLPPERLANRDLLPLLESASHRGVGDALGRHRLVEQARGALRRHGIPRLAMERLLFSFVLREETS